jgi:hypothetical protein
MVLLNCIYATSFKWDIARIKPKKGKNNIQRMGRRDGKATMT